MQTLTATYSPEDNKLRLYASSRLDAGLYQRLHDAGFRHAPKQDLFVAPMWTPAREDLLLQLCGEIGDEDTSLVDRAGARAGRFDDYSEKRGRESDAAHRQARSIMDAIPPGQPILVGHHSERGHRRALEKIDNNMRRASNLWETSQYWTRRAEGALRHAKYKAEPAVRHRRIKTLEADLRKQQRNAEEAQLFLKLWQRDGLTLDQARAIASRGHVVVREEGNTWGASVYSKLDDGTMTPQQAAEHCVRAHTATLAWCERWIAHYENRIAYERAMLAETGGLVADRFDIQPGGSVQVGGEWLVVVRVNRTGGRINSVTTKPPKVVTWSNTWKASIERVKDYRAPEAADAAAVKAATQLPPIVNYPGEGFLAMTRAEWNARHRDYKGTRTRPAGNLHDAYRYRCALAGGEYRQVYITDAKRADPPAVAAPAPGAVEATGPASLTAAA
jgi:hypothetical protein